MLTVIDLECLPNYRLFLRFSDGTAGTADLTSRTERAPFLALRDPDVFATAVVEAGAVEWPTAEVGIAPDMLYALAHELPVPKSFEQAASNEFTVSLAELRKLVGRSQTEVAETLEMNQSQLSRFERGDDRRLSSVRRYVEALGGELEVVAVFGGKRLVLRGV